MFPMPVNLRNPFFRANIEFGRNLFFHANIEKERLNEKIFDSPYFVSVGGERRIAGSARPVEQRRYQDGELWFER
jgi:hypothetical protein